MPLEGYTDVEYWDYLSECWRPMSCPNTSDIIKAVRDGAIGAVYDIYREDFRLKEFK